MRKLVLPCACALLMSLSGCATEEEIKAAKQIITSMPNEVAGCTFIADIDTHGSAMMDGARFFLKLEASKLGATHVVEQFAYPVLIGPQVIGVALTGRAYRCPQGLGPKLEENKAYLQFEIPSTDQILGDGEGLASIPNIDWREEYQRQQRR